MTQRIEEVKLRWRERLGILVRGKVSVLISSDAPTGPLSVRLMTPRVFSRRRRWER